jgi:hypothetical protein
VSPAAFLQAPLVFYSGREAEKTARSLAKVVAAAGHSIKVTVHDRSHGLAGTWHFFSDAAEVNVAIQPGAA